MEFYSHFSKGSNLFLGLGPSGSILVSDGFGGVLNIIYFGSILEFLLLSSWLFSVMI